MRMNIDRQEHPKNGPGTDTINQYRDFFALAVSPTAVIDKFITRFQAAKSSVLFRNMTEQAERMNRPEKAMIDRQEKYLKFTMRKKQYGIGITEDSVTKVLNIKSGEIGDTPVFGTHLNTDYILGMAKMERR